MLTSAQGADEKARIAAAFVAARRAAQPLARYPGTIPADLDAAYRIQAAAIGLWNAPIVGWKVGRIPAEQVARHGANRLAGPIFADGLVSGPAGAAAMPVFAGGFAAVEAEFVAVLASDPPAGQRVFSLDEAAGLIGRLHCGIEIASSPLGSINADGAAVTVSDFGNNAGLILGPEIADWPASAYLNWPVEVEIDGAIVGRARAADMLDGPVGAVRFLLETAALRGLPLRGGMLISTGAVSGVHEAAAGARAVARFGGRFEIACTLRAAKSDTTEDM